MFAVESSAYFARTQFSEGNALLEKKRNLDTSRRRLLRGGRHLILRFLAYSIKYTLQKASLYFFSPPKLGGLFPLKEFKPSLGH